MPINQGVISKQLTSSDVVTTAGKAGLLFGYNLIGGSTASSVVFNNGGSSGTGLWKGATPTATLSFAEWFDPPLVFSTDIYCTLAGTGATVSIAYKEIG